MLSTLLKLLRRTTYAALALLLALFAAVQIQQHLLRHRAEQLHADILALQLHPGTFADLQRLQTRWGAYGQYKGACTPASCRYYISQRHWLLTHDLANTRTTHLLFRAFGLLGGRAMELRAMVLLHDNRIWRSGYTLAIWGGPYGHSIPDPVRACDEGCAIFARIHEGPHLFDRHARYFAEAFRTGYKVGFEGFCTGCVGADVDFTKQTAPDDILALTTIDFNCITRWRNCETENELLPLAWPRRHSFEFRGPGEADTPFDKQFMESAPIVALGREAPDAIIVEVLNRKEPELDPMSHLGQGQVRITERLKNGRSFQPETSLAAEFDLDSIVGQASTLPQTGQRFIVICRGFGNDRPRYLDGLAYIPDTPQNRAEFLRGAALDNSGGEPDYDLEAN